MSRARRHISGWRAAIVCAAAALAGCGPQTQEAAPSPTPATNDEMSDMPFGYDEYDAMLAQYVNADGMVDYAAWKSERAGLDAFVASMGRVDRDTYASWDEAEQIAFWINAYNAITIQYILDHYPIQKGGIIASVRYPANSIRQIAGVWDKLTTPVLGEAMTLDHIEHEILRKEFDEPRIHVAIVCASVGCPPLRSEAYVGERLDAQLTSQGRAFLSKPSNFQIDRERATVDISSIFDWFGEDFIDHYNLRGEIRDHSGKFGAILHYASLHVSAEDAAYLRTATYSVDFTDYDWSLNTQ